jgi:hypothetical protein
MASSRKSTPAAQSVSDGRRVGRIRVGVPERGPVSPGGRERSSSIPPPISLEIPGLDDAPESEDLVPQSGVARTVRSDDEGGVPSRGGVVEEVTADLTKDPRHEK